MTNQTIDGVLVSRADLEAVCEDFGAGRHWQAMQGAQKLRALLDASSITCHACFAEGVSPAHFDEAGKCKAAQPQGKPFGYWLFPKGLPLHGMFHRVTETDKIIDSQSVVEAFEITSLYTKQPAPLHTMKSVMEAVEASQCHTVLTSNQCHALAQSLNAQQARRSEP